jgi:alginate O-acetyltransferase complex protein AlgI
MNFNSFEFALFFISFFILYWFIFNRNLKTQNILILAGSYFFYAWWDWRFLLLLICSSCINYFLGIYIEKTRKEKHRIILLLIGLFQVVGTLFIFKYLNFFNIFFKHNYSFLGCNSPDMINKKFHKQFF